MDLGEIINYSVRALANPKAEAKALVKKASFFDAAEAVALGALVPALILAVSVFLISTTLSTTVQLVPGSGVAMSFFGGAAAAALLIVVPILAVIAWIIESVLIWIVAMFMGGGGSFDVFAKAWAFPTAAFFALSWIPFVNVLLLIYMFYVLYCFLQPTMKLSPDQSVLAIVAIVIVAILLYFLTFWVFTLMGLFATAQFWGI